MPLTPVTFAWMRESLGKRFRAGYLLTLAEQALPFGDRITAAPLSALWDNMAVPARATEPELAGLLPSDPDARTSPETACRAGPRSRVVPAG